MENNSKKINDSKIYHILPFYNELDLLELRLEEHYNYVDKFIITESNKTHAGNYKDSYFLKNIDRYKKYQDKIIHLVCDFDSSMYQDYKINNVHYQRGASEEWPRDSFQRDYPIISNIIPFKEHDILIVTDADEIPNVDSVLEFLNTDLSKTEIYNLEMYFLHYYMDNVVCDKTGTFHLWSNFAFITKYSEIKKYQNSLSLIRQEHQKIKTIKNGGWHFSYLFDIDGILNKVRNFAHNQEECGTTSKKFSKLSPQDIDDAIKNYKVFYDVRYKTQNFSKDLLPKTIKNDLYKWKKFLNPNNSKDLVIIGSYPNTTISTDILKECILTLKDKFDIAITTHYPVNQDLQKLVQYYLYDSFNEILEENNPIVWNANESYYMQVHHVKNHSYSVYSLILNIVKLLEDKYEYFYYINGDTVIHADDIKKLCELKQIAIDNNKKCLFFQEFDGMVDAQIFFSNTKFYKNKIATINSKQEFLEYTKKFVTPYVPNVLESYFCEKIMSSLKNETHILRKYTHHYFENSRIDILNSFNGTPSIRRDYQVYVLKENNSDRIFFVYLNNNQIFEKKTISIKIDNDYFTLENGCYSYWKQISHDGNQIVLQVEDTINTYSVKDVLENTGTYIQFN